MGPIAILQRLESGELLMRLGDALAITAEEAVATGKPGKVTIEFVIKPESKDSEMVIVTPTLKRSTPKRESRGVLFYAVEGGLHREDPRQLKMEFRTVESPEREVREVANERQERIAQ